MLEWIADRVSRELAVIKGAPIAFCLAVTLTVSLATWALNWVHAEKFETQDQRIGLLTDQVQASEKESEQINNELQAFLNELKGISLTGMQKTENQEENIELALENIQKDFNEKIKELESTIDNIETKEDFLSGFKPRNISTK